MNHLGIILIFGGFGAVVHGSLVLSRIVGGGEAPDHKYPYQVSFRSTTYLNILVCSGSIVNKYWILTAGHCLIGKSPSDFVISAGTNNLNYLGYIYRPYLLVIHENYVSFYNNDIGMIRVAGEIIFNDFVQSIALPEEDLCYLSPRAMFAGWGRVKDEGVISSSLMEIELNILTVEDCQNKLNLLGWSHICTYNGDGGGICIGDSGAPLVVAGVQVGIASYLIECTAGYPDVFTRVSFYKDWIRNTMERYTNYIG